MFFSKKIQLPTTVAAYDKLVERLMQAYKLTDKNHTAAILSVAIRHLPPEQFTTTYQYLGDYIQKNIANYVANYKAQTLQHEAQVQKSLKIC